MVLHEVAHGWVASRLGDQTARSLGRLSLKPWRHLSVVGTLMLFVVGFGWAKPVPVDFSRLRPLRGGLVLVASAGIAANLAVAFLSLLLYRWLQPSPDGGVSVVLHVLFQVNVVLASFNLVPIPPLDGSKILMGFASRRAQLLLLRLEPYGFLVILALLYFKVLDPVIAAFRWAILAVLGWAVP
ncbi:MAG: site-2 protease family protein [Candidatus Latescibacterota bacterium]